MKTPKRTYFAWLLSIIICSGAAWLFIPALCVSDDTLDTVGSGVPISKMPDGFMIPLLSCAKDVPFGMAFAISPDGHKFVYSYRDDKRQKWGVMEIVNQKTIFNREEELGNNQFGVLDFVWSPDSVDLFVKLGFLDIGYGVWFKWDAKSEIFDDRDGMYTRLRKLPVSERSDVMFAGPRLDDSQLPPVWDMAGLRYANAREAEKKGVNNKSLQGAAFPAMECQFRATRNILRWKGKDYLVLSDISSESMRAYVLEKDKVVSTMSLAAPPANGLWFIRANGGRVTAMSRISQLSSQVSSQPAGAVQPKEWMAVDIGKLDMLLATYVLDQYVILYYIDAGKRKVILYDPKKLSSAGIE